MNLEILLIIKVILSKKNIFLNKKMFFFLKKKYLALGLVDYL